MSVTKKNNQKICDLNVSISVVKDNHVGLIKVL